MDRHNPSLRDGWQLLRRSPRLVLAVWIVPTLLLLPFVGTVQATLGTALGRLPARPAPGDLRLVLAHAAGRYGPALVVPVLLALVGTWLWTVLWHAGLVTWRVWAAGRPQRLGELLGLGISRLWRYLRLSLAAATGLALLLAAVIAPAVAWVRHAREALREAVAVNVSLGAAAAGALLALLALAATQRALWELARPGRRSAAAAWLRGFGGALRHPLATLGVLLAWLVPAALLWAGPLLAVAALGEAGRGPLGMAILQLAALLRAACWVGLVASFAPVAGLGPLPSLERPAAASGGDARRAAAASG